MIIEKKVAQCCINTALPFFSAYSLGLVVGVLVKDNKKPNTL